jgi:glycosyltransferase involved in cell wall biosynthesis
MTAVPRLTIGLPVYNGANYLAESLDALLGQSYENFELIISDNASTDGTSDICRRYERQDSRIRYFRQSHNIGLAPNHNFTVEQAGGELFKWASNDDLYGRDLLKCCVDALDEYPRVVLAHSWTVTIDSTGMITKMIEYPLATASLRAPERFRSVLFDSGGDDTGGVIRTAVLRRTSLLGSHHHADRTITAEMVLHGAFYQVPDWLYFRRDHPERAERACPTMRSRCANMDPRRADRLRNPAVRLYGEYVWANIAAIRRAPLSAGDRRECYRYLAQWVASRAFVDHDVPVDTCRRCRRCREAAGRKERLIGSSASPPWLTRGADQPASGAPRPISVKAIVPGQK